MVRIFKLSWLIMAVAISLVLISCGGNSSPNNDNWEDQSNNKCNGEQVRKENTSRSTKEDKTFTTSRGTFLLDKAINWSYEYGFGEGTSAKSSTFPSDAYDWSKGLFKTIWIDIYGVPSTPDAEEAFKTCRDNFNKGLDEGFRDDL